MEDIKQGVKKGKHPEKALTSIQIKNAKPGKHADGNGLYLQVDDSGSRRWVLRIVIKGKRCELGLGGLSLVSLSEAREEAARLRRIARIKNGDPLAERRRERRVVPTFEECARLVYEVLVPSFRNKKHAAQWITTLEAYVFPIVGNVAVDTISSADILRVLTPIWLEKAETARRVRQRMNSVFQWCQAKGYCAGNPIDGITKALPKNAGTKKHHSALPYALLPQFIQKLRAHSCNRSVRLALEFLIMTAARTSEVLLATWQEIELAASAWTIPKERMKSKVQHRVPLSSRCMEILTEVKALSTGSDYIFPGRSTKKPLSNMTFQKMMLRMNYGAFTPHGFRSAFRDWAEERSGATRNAIEFSLAHAVKGVEGAYLRTRLFDQRVPLMQAWSAYVTAAPKQKVVSITSRA